MNHYEFDVLIIGCGVAGLSNAIKLAESDLKIGIVTRDKDPKISNTYWAQGGVVYSTPEKDSFDDLVTDIFKASANTSYMPAVKTLAERSGAILKELLLDKSKTDFLKDEDGNLKFTLEAAHSRERIIYNGDLTGKVIQTSMLNYLKDKKRFPNVSLLTEHTAIDLLTPHHHGVNITQRYEEDQILGAYLFNQKTKSVVTAVARKTVLATGGIGALYLHHTNSEMARGDGHAMAKRAGANVVNMEFVQFHPTTFYDRSSHRRFLISEAVRGEGGVLINSKGERFMENYHPQAELAPRDVVARAILDEMIKSGDDCVYLDITDKDADWIKERFPTIYAHCKKKRLDITKHAIPVVPGAHYTCGGIKTDLDGKTNLKNLYAVGEVACTGLHGANRLASTSLLEGLTFGYIAAEDILKTIDGSKIYNPNNLKSWEVAHGELDLSLIAQDWLTIKQTMWNYVGIKRSANRLKRARAMFHELSDEIYRFYRNAPLDDSLIGLRNSVDCAFMVLNASMRNKDSVGCFYLE